MAKSTLQKLCNEASKKYQVHKIAVVHILGDCPVGQASVTICVSSVHRKSSIECTEFLINELKSNVPIWKKEVYEEGSAWKENIEWKQGKENII